MINKIKLAVAIAILAIIGILIALFAHERSRNEALKKEQASLREKARMSDLRRRIADSPVIEKKILYHQDTKGRKKEAQITDPCFQNYQYQFEAKDEAGRWVFSDDNVFDERPGSLVLTDKFWAEQAGPAPSLSERAVPKPKRLKNEVRLGFELDRARLEYAYSPLGFRADKMELNLQLYGGLATDYTWTPTEARAGVGVEVRF